MQEVYSIHSHLDKESLNEEKDQIILSLPMDYKEIQKDLKMIASLSDSDMKIKTNAKGEIEEISFHGIKISEINDKLSSKEIKVTLINSSKNVVLDLKEITNSLKKRELSKSDEGGRG